MKVAPRPGIADLAEYMVGLSKLPGFNTVAKLSSNEGPLGPSEAVREAIVESLAELHRYPEVDTERLQEAIARRFGLDPSRIVCGPGSDEVLGRLVRTYAGAGEEVIHSVHAYMQFPSYAVSAGATPVAAPDRDFRHDVESIVGCVTDRTRIVIVANPDNPSGTYLSGREIRRLRSELPGRALLILDAAYDEYAHAPDYESGASLVERCDNVVMTRSFSKAFGLAGLRLGWCYAPSAIVDALNIVGPLFPVSVPAFAAGIAALGDLAHTKATLAHNRKWVSWLSGKLIELGLHVYRSQTNFVLVRFPSQSGRTAAEADAFLLARGIIARRFSVLDFEDKLRISIGLDHEMRAVVDALREFLSEAPRRATGN